MRPLRSALLKRCGAMLVAFAIAEMMWMAPAPVVSFAPSERSQAPDRWTRFVLP